MNPRAKRFPLLDSLRGLGVVVVLITHVSVAAGITAGSDLRPFITNTTWVIAVFFLLSAFLLYRPYARARIDGKRRPQLGAYGWGRFLRVVPPFWVALTICAVWLGRDEDVFSLSGIPIYYGFAQIYFDQHVLGGLAVAWSLCVEVVFYALLPVWAALMLRVPGATREARIRGELAMLTGLVVIGLTYRVLLAVTDIAEHSAALLALPAYLDWIAVGMIFAVASVWLDERPTQPAVVRAIERWPGACWLVGLALYWFVSTQVGPLYGYPDVNSADQVFEHVLLLAVALAFFLPTAFGDPDTGLLRRFLGNPAVLYLGMTSYAIYLWHIPVFEQLKKWDLGSVDLIHPYLLWPLVTLAISVAIATVSWYGIEKPALSLKRLVGPQREPQPAEATAEPTASAALSR